MEAVSCPLNSLTPLLMTPLSASPRQPNQESGFRRRFVEFAIARNVLCFGEFKTKAGRLSPYFFNAGLFHDGASLRELCRFYAEAIRASGISVDMLFGPAYKGIVLAAGTAMALAEFGQNLPFCYNRKEAKDHGEGGITVGAPLKGRVLIIDDVISAGTSVRESVDTIRSAGATPAGVVIALDRQERGQGSLSAVQEVSQSYGMPVITVATLLDVIAYLGDNRDKLAHLERIEEYKKTYGAVV